MGLRYRKSFGSKMGRVTVSKSGVGFSVGTKGYRVTKKAGGGYRTTNSIPGTGISYTKDTGRSKRSTNSSKSPSSMKIDWKIVVACLFFFLALRCGLADDGVPQLTAFFVVCGVALCVWVGFSGKKKTHKEDVEKRLYALSDAEFKEYKESMLNYVQSNRESSLKSSDMKALVQAIREEDERRNSEKSDRSYHPESSQGKTRRKRTGCLGSVMAVLLFFALLGACGDFLSSEEDAPIEEAPPVVETVEIQEQEEVDAKIVEQPTEQKLGVQEPTVQEPVAVEPTSQIPSAAVEQTVEEEPAIIPPSDPLSGVEQEPVKNGEVVYYTDTGGKYHRAGCRHLAESKHETTLDDAVNNKHLSPCGICY